MFFSAGFKAEASGPFKNELLGLDGVVSVDEIVQSGDVFSEKYIAWFEQPIDWDSPDIGTFLQRVEIGFSGWASVNVVQVNGYGLRPSRFPLDDRSAIAKMYNANYVNIEYRYFSKSIPDGLSEDSTALWQYLNNKNASNDFHKILSQLKRILSGTWAFTGGSKGGQAVNVFSYYYPNDADVYVSYVAPFCIGTEDMRVMDAIYTSIGNERYGEAQAQGYRDMMLKFQVEAIRNRDYLQPRLSDFNYFNDNSLRPFRTPEHQFEWNVVDFVGLVWLYDHEFASVDAVLKMPHETSEDKKIYLDAMVSLMEPSKGSYSLFPYVYQAYTENGAYGFNLSYLREAVEREGLSLVTTEEEEVSFEAKMNFTDEQLRVFKYDQSLRDEMLNWTHTTKSNVIMIYGNSDPWYFARLPDVDDNPNVHIFTTSMSHAANIAGMPSEQQAEITELLDRWLLLGGWYHKSGSASGCNAGVPVMMIMPLMLFFLKRR